MQCPNCGSECWDNRQKVADGWKGPLWKCKDKECAWVRWPERPKKDAKPQQGRANGQPKWTWGALSTTYERSLRLAAKHVLAVSKEFKLPAPPEAVISAAATIFIAASRDGVAPLKAQEQPVEEKPQQLAEGDPDDDLPF